MIGVDAFANVPRIRLRFVFDGSGVGEFLCSDQIHSPSFLYMLFFI